MAINHARWLAGLEHCGRSAACRLALLVIALAALCSAPVVHADEQIHLKVVGGLAGVSQ